MQLLGSLAFTVQFSSSRTRQDSSTVPTTPLLPPADHDNQRDVKGCLPISPPSDIQITARTAIPCAIFLTVLNLELEKMKETTHVASRGSRYNTHLSASLIRSIPTLCPHCSLTTPSHRQATARRPTLASPGAEPSEFGEPSRPN